jgi:uncharacterized protein HemX
MTWKDVLIALLSALGAGALTWLRFRKKDTAETHKVHAEAKKVSAEADSTIADGFKKLMAIQEAELLKKISQLEELERVLRLSKDELRQAQMAFVEKENTYRNMILELTTKVHELETDIKNKDHDRR